jgi:hypothetical protein
MNNRRLVGGYVWQEKLDKVRELSERVNSGLVVLSKQARTVETANQITQLVALTSQISVTAMELKEYRS